MRAQKALYNSISFLILEVVSIIYGFIVPKLILSAFGSSYNGIITSITQFLSMVVLLRAGVGGVTRAALYKPLADNNMHKVSSILNATEKFMRKIAFIFTFFLILFACIYPIFILENFEWFFTFSLVIIIGISTFVQYYFTITYQMLLIADQRQYVIALIQCLTLILNLLITVILIKCNYNIHIIKLGSSIVYCLNPILICIYVKRKYQISKNAKTDDSALIQRWDAFTHQLAGYIQENTDVVVLTIFDDIKEVSVYSVYYLIANGVKKMLEALTTGIEAAFGNMIALNDYDSLKKNMKRIEYVLFSFSTIFYSCLLILILPFIQIYTKGIIDANYIRPMFAILLTISQFFYCVRTPYMNLIEAAGHFKETKKYAIIEAALNLSFSIIAVLRFGLVGVVIGTLISIVYRTIQLARYASKTILHRTNWYFVKRIVISIFEVVTILGGVYIVENEFIKLDISNYLNWFIYALMVGIFSVIVVLIFSIIFDKEIFYDCSKKIKSIVKKENNKR